MAAAARFRIAVRRFGPFETAIAERWESFRRATGCDLELEAVPLDLPELHATLFDEGGLRRGRWDAAFIVTDWLAEAAARGDLLDLSSRIAAQPPEDYPGGWADSLLRHQRFGGAVYGLPVHDGPECLVYRTDLIAAPPRTWDEFRAAATRFSDPGAGRWGTVFAGFPDGHNTVYDFCLQIWSRGGELFDGAGRPQLATPAAEAALEFFRSFRRDPAVHPESPRLDSVQSGDVFARGEAALMVNWFGFAALAASGSGSRVRGRVGVAPVPAGPSGRPVSLNVYWVLGVGSGTARPDAAYAFLRHCVSAEGDRKLTLGGAIGCRRSTWTDPEVRRTLPFFAALEELHCGARELPRLAGWPRIAHVIDGLMVAAADSAQPVRALLDRAQARLSP